MKNNIRYFIAICIIALVGSCEKDREIPDFSQPNIQYSVEGDTFNLGGEIITVGPDKEYENDSEVIYRLNVTSERKLSRFTVMTSSDAFSQESRILKTEPAGVIDEDGNFLKDLNEVVIYYAYHIHPLTKAGTGETITFTLFNDKNRSSIVYHNFTVIKQGSTSGNKLNVIDLSWTDARSNGIGIQDNLDEEVGGTRPYGMSANKRGPLFSFKYGVGFTRQADAVANADEIDFVGYRTRYTGSDPVLTNSRYYLCSPSDTTVLNTAYAGAQVASFMLSGTGGEAEITFAGITGTAKWRSNVNTTVSDFYSAYRNEFKEAGYDLSKSSAKLIWKNNKPVGTITDVSIKTISGNLTGVMENKRDWMYLTRMRETMRLAEKQLNKDGKGLRVVYFKRLDNIEGANQVTPEEFDVLTHDNEFDNFLEGIVEEGATHIGPMELNQVWGFVMSDGKRGLLRTAPFTVFLDGVDKSVQAPNSGQWNLYGVIKYQKN